MKSHLLLNSTNTNKLNIPVQRFSGVISFNTEFNGITFSVIIAGDSEYISASLNLTIPGCLIVFIRLLFLN